MRKLSAMDASFLYLETPETPMHGASLQFLELPEGHAGDFHADLQRHLVESIPRFRFFHERLHDTPLHLDHPVWIEAEEVDLAYHFERVVLEPPGDIEHLIELAEQLHLPLLDRTRPLWRYTLIEGLADGQRVLHTKGHHACMDGMASQELLRRFYSRSPEGTGVTDVTGLHAEPEPDALALLRDAYAHVARQPARTLSALPEAAKSLFQLGVRALDGGLLPRAPRTRFDVTIGAARRFAMTTLPLDAVRRIARSEGTTVNDVVMSLCGRALRRYLAEKGELPKEPLVAFAPVSLRSPGEDEMDNRVFGMFASLATHLEDPLEQLAAVHDAAVVAKEQTQELRPLIPHDFGFLGAPALIEGVVGLLGSWRVVERLPQLFNVVISNVPGPREPLYLCGARLLGQYPMSMPMHGCALNITVMSYAGSLDFGLIACHEAVPDVDRLGRLLEEAHAELSAAVPA